MPKLQSFLVAGAVSHDTINNVLSASDILGIVHARKFPSTLPQIVALAVWRREDSDFDDDQQDFFVRNSSGG
jgi:hypothetical protein